MVQFQHLSWGGHHIPEQLLSCLSVLLAQPSPPSAPREETVRFKFVAGEPRVISQYNMSIGVKFVHFNSQELFIKFQTRICINYYICFFNH